MKGSAGFQQGSGTDSGKHTHPTSRNLQGEWHEMYLCQLHLVYNLTDWEIGSSAHLPGQG